jgi:hypothetical protein
MDMGNYVSMGRPRHSERSVVVPTVMVDTPERPSSTAGRSKRRKSAPHLRHKRPIAPDSDFKFFIDQRGRQHFNFKQVVWLDPSVQMAFTRVYSIALKTLAANVLALTLKTRYRTAIGPRGPSAVLLASSFSRECLLGAPDEAWVLPKSTIESWLDSKKRQRSHKTGRRAR